MNGYLILYLISVTMASISQLLLKKSATIKHTDFIHEYLNPWVIIGYAMLFSSMFLTILAYKGIEYKYGPVIESLGYVIVLVLSRIFFAEKIFGEKLLGIACILLGIVIFNL